MAWLASLAGAVMLLSWGSELPLVDHPRLWGVAAAFGGLYAVGCYLTGVVGKRRGSLSTLSAASGVDRKSAGFGHKPTIAESDCSHVS